MPSPIGHSLIGLAIATLGLAPQPSLRDLAGRAWKCRWWMVGCMVVANLPDLDFLPGILNGDLNAFHHGFSHSLGWILLVAVGLWSIGRGMGRPWRARALVFIGLLLFSHLVADYLCEDRSAPYGILFWWPIESGWQVGPWPVFAAMQKATIGSVFSPANLVPALREAAVGGLLLVLALGCRISRKSATACDDSGSLS